MRTLKQISLGNGASSGPKNVKVYKYRSATGSIRHVRVHHRSMRFITAHNKDCISRYLEKFLT